MAGEQYTGVGGYTNPLAPSTTTGGTTGTTGGTTGTTGGTTGTTSGRDTGFQGDTETTGVKLTPRQRAARREARLEEERRLERQRQKVLEGQDASVVPGTANKNDPSQINVVDYASQVATNPALAFVKDNPATPRVNESMSNVDHLDTNQEIKTMTDKGLIDGTANKFQMDADAISVDPTAVAGVDQLTANGYDVATTQEQVAQNEMTGAVGTVSDEAQITDVPQVDLQGIGTGVNADGSVSYTGQALKNFAVQDFTNIVDTSTVAGKLLADSLGQGNYTDAKATLKGQLDILQGEFIDPATGEPKIPSWAAATSRNVSKIAAFKGMSGSAATAAMAQALLEASIPIAQADSTFFQTLTVQNLNNKQQSIINTANTLAKFEQTNVDNRMAAAIQNSKAFLEMDMANLSNEQQAKVINNQARVQSILEDAKAQNAERLFVADSQNELDKFYQTLNTQIATHNSTQTFEADKYNADMEDSRERFYKEMQYNISIANAKWRQAVQLQEDTQQHEAATTDVKNLFDMSVNQLNQIWERSDSLLDYAWKSSESEKDRKAQLALAALQGEMAADAATTEALGLLAGTFVGSDFFSSSMGKIFS